MPKQKLTLSIDKDIITQAKKQKINLSSFLEIRLIDYLGEKKVCSRREGNCNLLVKIVELFLDKPPEGVEPPTC